MAQEYPRFTKEMKATHTILVPNMAPLHFALLKAVLKHEGYKIEVLGNCGSQVAQLGLQYVHNDTCYPALLVIGQFLDALQSGRYDLDHTALLITQTGGGCRASNYIHLLRKALQNAGFGQIPVASLNFSGLEKDSGFQTTLPMLRGALAAVLYGDLLMTLQNQTAPYEKVKGQTEALTKSWVQRLSDLLQQGKGMALAEVKRGFEPIVQEFAAIPKRVVPKVKVGVVGEIYVKYSPLGNNDLCRFLADEDCEVNMPGLLGFVQYCIYNPVETARLYGGPVLQKTAPLALLDVLDGVERAMGRVLRDNGYHAALPFKQLTKLPQGIIGMGVKMGEGWLLTAEMVELVRSGYENIICAQPFGCLPNHICGKGMINKIRAQYPLANITPIDYDPSAARVNQENRIKLMLAVAKERLDQNGPGQAGQLVPDPKLRAAAVRPLPAGAC